MTRRVIMFIIVENWPFNLVLYSFENDLVSCFERIIVIVLCCNLLIRERSSFAVLIRRYSMETEMPDLSHLTPEERRVIENVLMRQRQEEEQERLIVEKKREEMKILEETIQKQRNEMHKKAGSDMEATCHICMKTKFADGIGHICNYCNIRCCARCGGKVTLRSNKVIWVCILCRKKQELLGKTGQWINQRMSSNEPVSKPEQDRDLSVLSDKRAKLERTQSAAEKENQPLERSGSLLRRQYSHQEQSSRSSDSMTRMEKNRSREEEMRQRKEMEARQSTGRHMRRGEISGYKSDSYTSEKSLDRLENPPQRSGSSTVIYPSPSRKHRRSSKGEPPLRKDNQMGIKSQKNLPHQSFSSSDDELKSLSECTSEERDYDKNSLDRRDKMKPSVMITSPGSPDINTIYRSRNSRFMQGANSSIGGRIQMKLWFDSSTLNLVVTVVCAVGLIPRSNGQPRNTYAKLYLLPDRSEKSKRRTKTLANTNEPRWNQNFIYSSVRRSDLKVKMIEISVWDYMKNSFNDFLGEARIELAIAPLNNEAEWIHLGPHEELVMPRNDFGSYIPSDHLSPPSTTSRLSDSDTSDFDDSNRRVADGASISSLGSSTSPPPDYEKNERRKSRRDTISPQDYNKTSSYKGSLYKHQSLERDVYTKTSYSGYPQRSRSAAPTDTPSLHYRSRSKSPTRVYERSLSPTSHRAQSYGSVYPVPAYGPKMYTTRSATSTPISSPKRRLLPKIPVSVSPALRERIAHDLENRGLYFKNRMRQTRPSGGRFSGWSRHHYSGLSDGDLPHQHRSLSPPSARELGFLCGPKKEGDVEDSYSIDSSTFSTQSEQPQKSRFELSTFYSDYGARRGSSHQSPSTSGPAMESLERSLSHSDMPSDKNIESSLSDLTLHSLPPSNESQRNKCSPNTSERGSVKSIPGARGSPDSLSSLPKKSNSTSQLSATGRKRRLGFGSSIKSSFTVQRSEEIFPDEVRHLVKQTSSISSDGDGSQDGDSAVALKMAEEEKYQNFIGTLGPGQLVGRQVLGTPPLGEVEVSISTQKGRLEVEVVRVKGLQQNPAFKNLPTPYAKLYLVKGKKCLEKMKTKSSQPTLEPIYQSRFLFKTNPEGCVLQITLWGDYGRLDARKVFMGITQIALSNLDLNKRTIGWYKLFKTCMLVSSGSGPLQISSSL
ncbi:regulating synaptic membrane exocytosis protein 2 isoform X7 [Planococcus citri]|uniref:regulating synaptic membrane exocytosis protein 2 isoform X7 n=1 Tax=Planococcus citri TaxID=170843 RepID=UPI0031F8C456